MSEAYNPESDAYEQLEALELQARRLRPKRDEAGSDDERQVLDRQLQEIEHQIDTIRRRLKS